MAPRYRYIYTRLHAVGGWEQQADQLCPKLRTPHAKHSAAECAEIYRRTKQAVGRIPYLGEKVRMHAYAPIESKPREKERIQNPKACRGSHPLQGNQRLVDATAVKPLGSHGQYHRASR